MNAPDFLDRYHRSRQILRAEYGNSPNLMTPEKHRIDLAIESEAGAFAYELSSGRGLYGEPIFGMSIVRAYRGGRTRRCYRLSGCHRSRSAAMAVVYRMQNLYNFVRKARASNGEVAN